MKTQSAVKKISRGNQRDPEEPRAVNPPPARLPDDGVTTLGIWRRRLGKAGQHLAFLKHQLSDAEAAGKIPAPLAVARRFRAGDVHPSGRTASAHGVAVRHVIPVSFPDFTSRANPPAPVAVA